MRSRSRVRLGMAASALLMNGLFLFATCAGDVMVVEDGRARAVICAPARVLAADDAAISVEEPRRPPAEAEFRRQQLRKAIEDLARCLKKMSGAQVEIVPGPPLPEAGPLPLCVGELAEQVFGPPAKSAPYRQGFRVVVSPRGIGLMGESDLAASYAVYELLDRLGCRWFMPTEMGECIPELKSVTLPEMDFSSAPGTIYRGIWYADDDYKRRNRLGGLVLAASHALDSYLSPQQLEKHLEWIAVVQGKPAPPAIKWTRPEIADALAEHLIDSIGRTGVRSLSLSPEDTVSFDESEDPRFDAGDIDPILGTASVTDRLMVLCNRVADRVTAKYPDTLFGMIAYVNYTRAPVREKVHPSLVPVIAPITYSRAHPITDDGEPNNRAFRALIEGWGKAARMIGCYFYGYNLAEMAAPNPMITKWSVDVPYILRHGCQFFQPETSTNFESSMHALYLGPRLAWEPQRNPQEIIDDLHARFYGHAAKEMGAYWHFIDDAWVKTPEYSGAGHGYIRRFTPEVMKKARELLNAGMQAARGTLEKARVTLAHEAFSQFELYMKMRYDLNEGRWGKLDSEAERWIGKHHALAERYRPQCAFTARTYGAGGIWGSDNGVDFFVQYYKGTYDDAARIARFYNVLNPQPLRRWRYQADADRKGEALGWSKPDFDDRPWKETDVAAETWSTLGYHNTFGRMWYRASVPIPSAGPGRKTFLWIGATDGSARVFLNGVHVPFTGARGQKADEFAGFCQPASFDITAAVKADAANQITILCERVACNEIGVGGLLAPVAVYAEKP
ncbi:MAG: DUF4838 domain-containing protein [Planctomycetes bacterium]|nr:DUF4838 domain-containing protein [Planctomycetota bacterium]